MTMKFPLLDSFVITTYLLHLALELKVSFDGAIVEESQLLKKKNFPCRPMDSSIITALSAILGTTVGGLTTFATTLLNQRYAARRDILAKDVANREQLYSEFLKEVGSLYFDSLNRTLDDTSQQASMITMYSLVGRIRMISSEAVLTSAEKVTEDIIECYKRPPTTFQEFQQSWEDSNPWHEFTKACRAERQSMLGGL